MRDTTYAAISRAPLARLEAQRAIAALLGRYSVLRLGDAPPTWRPTFVLHGLSSLRVVTA